MKSTHSVDTFLERIFARYHRAEYLYSDPLEFVHRYTDPWDREAVAIFGAVLAYGNVKQVRASVEKILGLLVAPMVARPGDAPAPGMLARAIREFRPESRAGLAGFKHRFNVADDFAVLVLLLQRSWRAHGSVGAHFLRLLPPDAADFSPALDALVREWKAAAREFPFWKKSFDYLLTAPEGGSTCKRWCMLLRWMGRQDSLDPGLWRAGSPLLPADSPGLRASQLVLPLDTHTSRISQYIGLTKRKSMNWKAAVEITDRLRGGDAADPVKYDFALARLGILSICKRKYRAEICEKCDLRPVCKFANAGEKRAARTAKRRR